MIIIIEMAFFNLIMPATRFVMFHPNNISVRVLKQFFLNELFQVKFESLLGLTWRLCMISLDTYFYEPLFKVPTLKLKTVNLVCILCKSTLFKGSDRLF